MGNDPATCVLDPHCKAHDLGNLYVVDASCSSQQVPSILP
jgi:choline dehydrogenase-like flavoprotein